MLIIMMVFLIVSILLLCLVGLLRFKGEKVAVIDMDDVRSFEKVLDNHSSSVASSIYILSNSLLAAKA
jgi:hypothetical protein